jgi:hypothetical protein
VERFIPKLFAAPLGPAITHFVCFNVARKCLRSASSMVWHLSKLGPVEISELTPRLDTCSTWPRLRITARSMKFWSSRIFPGQEWVTRSSLTLVGISSICLPICFANILTKCSTRSGISSRRDPFRNLPGNSLRATRILAEHLLNNKLQMSACGATERLVTLTKQLKIGLCEQVRVN